MGIYQPPWKIPIANDTQIEGTVSSKKRHIFNIDQNVYENQQILRLRFKKNTLEGFTVRLRYDPTPVDMHVGVIFAALILLTFYVLLIYEVITLYSMNNKIIHTVPFLYVRDFVFVSVRLFIEHLQLFLHQLSPWEYYQCLVIVLQ